MHDLAFLMMFPMPPSYNFIRAPWTRTFFVSFVFDPHLIVQRARNTNQACKTRLPCARMQCIREANLDRSLLVLQVIMHSHPYGAYTGSFGKEFPK